MVEEKKGYPDIFDKIDEAIKKNPLTDDEIVEIEGFWQKSYPKKYAKIFSKIGENFFSFFFKNYCKLIVKNRENLPSHGSFIIASNHTSHLDSIALIQATGRKIDDFVLFGAKDYFFHHKFNFKFLHLFLNLVPFDRTWIYSAFRKNMAHIKKAKEDGKIMILFPEGTRSPDGKIQEFRPSIAYFAEELDVPIVPAYIKGTFELFPKGSSFPKPGQIEVHFGKPLKIDRINGRYKSYLAFVDTLKEEILKLKSDR